MTSWQRRENFIAKEIVCAAKQIALRVRGQKISFATRGSHNNLLPFQGIAAAVCRAVEQAATAPP
jgi:hypothetical protein